MYRTIALVILPQLLFPLVGRAQTPAAPWYLSIDGGVTVAPDSSVDYGGEVLPSKALQFRSGWGVVGTTGREIYPSFRVEGQVGHTQNSVRDIIPGVSPSGSASATTTMLVGCWQWPSGSRVRPFAALGGGRAWVAQNLTADGANLSDTSASAWAYQASVGAFIRLTERLDLDISYRYIGTQRGIFLDNHFVLYHSGFANHAALLGLTWRVR